MKTYNLIKTLTEILDQVNSNEEMIINNLVFIQSIKYINLDTNMIRSAINRYIISRWWYKDIEEHGKLKFEEYVEESKNRTINDEYTIDFLMNLVDCIYNDTRLDDEQKDNLNNIFMKEIYKIKII